MERIIFGTKNLIEHNLPGWLDKIVLIEIITREDSAGQRQEIVRYRLKDDPQEKIQLKVFTFLTATYGNELKADGTPFVGVHNGGRGYEEFY